MYGLAPSASRRPTQPLHSDAAAPASSRRALTLCACGRPHAVAYASEVGPLCDECDSARLSEPDLEECDAVATDADRWMDEEKDVWW